jgi:uncharacterized protein YecE (DUF72 family)
VDSSYYSIPAQGTVDHWAELTPPGFLFSLKFPKSIVHGGRGATPDGQRLLVPDATYSERDRFLEVTSRLGAKCGPLLLQFPYLAKRVFAGLEPFLERLEGFLHDLPRDRLYALEVRNKSWLVPALLDLCRRYHVALATCDQAWMPRPWEIPKALNPMTASYSYARLIGDREEIEALTTTWGREVIDRSSLLEKWAEYLAGLHSSGVLTLVYINNHFAGFAPATALRLRALFLAKVNQRT